MATATAKKQDSNTPLTDNAREAAHRTIDKVADQASGAEINMRETAENSSQNFDEAKENIKAQLDSSISKAKQLSKENPMAAVGIAFAAGALVSMLLRRS